MDRLDELKNMLEEVGELPESLGIEQIKQHTKRKAIRHHVVRAVTNLVLAFGVFVGALSIGVNTSPVFADIVKDIPVIGLLAEAVDFNNGIADAVENEYGTPIDVKCKGEVYDFYVDYVMADDRSLVLFFRTDNDGGKKAFTVNVENCMLADGTEIESSYHIPDCKSDGNYGMLLYEWDEYCPWVSMDLLVYVYEGEAFNGKRVGQETYHIDLDIPEKYEAKVFEVNREITVDDAVYQIGQVRMYPLSTEIDVRYLNEDEVKTLWMDFCIEDESGNKVETAKSGIIGKESDDGNGETIVIESGYFSCGENKKLTLNSVELLSADRQIVTLDLDTLEFTDVNGVLPELTNAVYDKDYEAYTVGLTGERNWKFDNLFHYYLDENGEEQFLGLGRTEDGFLLWLEDPENPVYIAPDNRITLIRDFPDRVVNPDLTIDLEECM